MRLPLGLAAFLLLVCQFIYGQDGDGSVGGAILYPVDPSNISLITASVHIEPVDSDFDVTTTLVLKNETKMIADTAFELDLGDGRTYPHEQSSAIQDVWLTLEGTSRKFTYRFVSDTGMHVLTYNIGIQPGTSTIIYNQLVEGGTGESQGEMSFDLSGAWKWKGKTFDSIEVVLHGRDGLYEFSDLSISKFIPIGVGKSFALSNFQDISIKNGYLYSKLQADENKKLLAFRYENMFFSTFSGQGISIGQLGNDPLAKFGKVVFWWEKLLAQVSLITNKSDREYIQSKISGFEEYAKNCSSEDRRLIRNTIFAMHGYVFRDRNLNDYFLGQYWYFPNPNLPYESISLSPYEQAIIEYLAKLEAGKS